MPKSQIVEPTKERQAGSIPFAAVPLNQYQNDLTKEKENYGDDALIGIYEDMLLIREFESMLQSIKTQGSYEGIEYDHKGPAHLSIGQEASAVGQAFLLDVDDHILGSHRSHGEILAKGMSAIRKLDEDSLLTIMKEFLGGDCFRVVEKEAGCGDVKDLARDFLLYGALAEIFGRENGFNRGLGGSMHAFFPPFGILPNNAIVGGSADIATGAALFKKVNRKNGLVISNIGDASMGCGPTWEAMNFASMRQFHELWDESMRGGLPIIFNFMNNFYGMGGQTAGETMAFDYLARVGAGVNPDSMHAERVDGYNPLAVADAIRRKRELIEKGEGPILLETITYRFSGHSPSDASSYRIKEEIEAWQSFDPINAYAKELTDAGLLNDDAINSRKTDIVSAMTKAFRLASDLEVSPRLPSEKIAGLMFSSRKRESYDPDREPELLLSHDENPRVQALTKKSRAGIIDGKPVSKNKVFQYRDAIFEAALHRFESDPTMVAYGEENRDWGGAFACYRGLTESLPYHRLFNSPISEAAIVGTACGYALEGGRALVELMYCDFMGRAGDEIFNQLAKWQSMSACILEMPVTLRVSVGSKYGAQHSQDWCALVNHIPGLKVVFPSTPYDAKGMLNTALAGSDPVIFFESQRLYDIGELFEKEVPAEYYEVPFGPPAQRRVGKDITIITVGATMYRALEAADILKQKYGVTSDVFDCRSISPLDYDPLVASVRKTGKVLLSSDACERGSVLHDIASKISQLAFDDLDAPPVVVGSRNWITPCAEVESDFFPQPAWMIDAIHDRIMSLAGHQLSTNPTTGELLKRQREGV